MLARTFSSGGQKYPQAPSALCLADSQWAARPHFIKNFKFLNLYLSHSLEIDAKIDWEMICQDHTVVYYKHGELLKLGNFR